MDGIESESLKAQVREKHHPESFARFEQLLAEKWFGRHSAFFPSLRLVFLYMEG